MLNEEKKGFGVFPLLKCLPIPPRAWFTNVGPFRIYLCQSLHFFPSCSLKVSLARSLCLESGKHTMQNKLNRPMMEDITGLISHDFVCFVITGYLTFSDSLLFSEVEKE